MSHAGPRTSRYAPLHACDLYVVVSLQAPEHDTSKSTRRPVRISFVIDRSGSMAGEKLALAVAGVTRAIASLDVHDTFSVVAFDDEAHLIVGGSAATSTMKRVADERLRGLHAGSYTNLSGGWMLGADELAASLGADDVGRCVLLTDGQANRGQTDHPSLGESARRLRRLGIATTTIGLGADFDEALLGVLAEEGGGNFHFAANATQLVPILVSELSGTLAVCARDVVIELAGPANSAYVSLNGFATDDGAALPTFVVGSLQHGERIDAVFRLTLPPAAEGAENLVRARVRDRDDVLGLDDVIISWTRTADPWRRTAIVDNPAMLLTVAQLEAALAHRTALACNAARDYKGAVAVIDDAAVRIRRLEQTPDAALRAVVDKLLEERDEYRSAIDRMRSKERYSRSYTSMKRRMAAWMEDVDAGVTADGAGDAALDRHEAAHVDEPRADASGSPFSVAPLVDRRAVRLYGSDVAMLPAIDLARRVIRPGIAARPAMLVGIARVLTQRASPLSRSLPELDDAALRAAVPALAMLVVPQALEGDARFWWDDTRRFVVVSTALVGRWRGERLEAFLAMQLLVQGLRMHSAHYDPQALEHATRGCLYDATRNEADVLAKLHGATVCTGCAEKLAALDIDPRDVRAAFDAVRAHAALVPID